MSNNVALINAVKTPLAFFAMIAIVILTALLGSMKLAADEHKLILQIFLGIAVLLILVVGGITVWKPGVLTGKPYDVDILGYAIGAEIYFSFDPYISNLPDQERLEAYESLLLQMESPADTANQLIRKKIANVIRQKAGIEK